MRPVLHVAGRVCGNQSCCGDVSVHHRYQEPVLEYRQFFGLLHRNVSSDPSFWAGAQIGIYGPGRRKGF